MEVYNTNHSFLKDWDREPSDPLFSRMTGRLHHSAPVKEKVANAIYRLRVLQNKLESASNRMQQHDRDIFAKCVNSQVSHDPARAAMYANECAEVRKMAKVTMQCQLALEQVSLRLETIEEFGDIASLMRPVASVVHSIKNQISGVIPEVGFELGEIGEVLNSVVVEAGEATGSEIGVEASSAEAQRILAEASAITEQHMKERFPELPAGGAQVPERTGETNIPH